MSYISITRISKAYGFTVNQFKKQLSELGLWGFDGPTERALADGSAMMFPVSDLKPDLPPGSKTHYPKWNTELIGKKMAEIGIKPGDRKVVTGRHAAVIALEQVGYMLSDMPGADTDFANMLVYGSATCKVGNDILFHNDQGLLTSFRHFVTPIRDFAKRKRGKWKANAAEIVKDLDAIDAFLVRQGCS